MSAVVCPLMFVAGESPGGPMTGTTSDDLTMTAAAASVGRCEATIRRWVVGGLLKARKVGGRVVIRRADLARLLAGAPVKPRPRPRTAR